MQFLEKLDKIEVRFEELTQQMADPAVIHDADQYRKIAKAHSELSDVVTKYREWKKVHSDLAEARGMLGEAQVNANDLLSASLHGPRWITGGSIGPEGSVLAFAVLGVGFVIFDRLFRQRV